MGRDIIPISLKQRPERKLDSWKDSNERNGQGTDHRVLGQHVKTEGA